MCDYGKQKSQVVNKYVPTPSKFVVEKDKSNLHKLAPGDCCSIWMGYFHHDFVYVGDNKIVERSKEASGVTCHPLSVYLGSYRIMVWARGGSLCA